jgi:phosphomannomutase
LLSIASIHPEASWIPVLLKALGVEDVVELYCEPNGQFPHNPEPLPENLGDISKEVKKRSAHLGIVVDPDVDRLLSFAKTARCSGKNIRLLPLPTMS